MVTCYFIDPCIWSVFPAGLRVAAGCSLRRYSIHCPLSLYWHSDDCKQAVQMLRRAELKVSVDLFVLIHVHWVFCLELFFIRNLCTPLVAMPHVTIPICGRMGSISWHKLLFAILTIGLLACKTPKYTVALKVFNIMLFPPKLIIFICTCVCNT